MSKEFYVRQLQKLSAKRQCRIEEHAGWITCPIHNKGNESTPSLKINLDNSAGFKPGEFRCFACGFKDKNWNVLAKELDLKKQSEDDDLDVNLSDAIKKNLFGDEEDQIKSMKKEYEFSPLWKKSEKWRDISGKLLHKLNARLIATEYGNRMYLPVTINGAFKGGITCALKKHKKYPAYINDPGPWTREVLLGYDYAKKLLKKQNKRVLFAGEGPRDALNPLQFGIPTVATLGGSTVWRQEKADLILSLEPDLLVIASDPDLIGNKLAQMMHNDLSKEVKTIRLNFPEGDQKQDLGNMSKKRCYHLKQQLGII